eukprot:2225437-Rhodomonas_salina.10
MQPVRASSILLQHAHTTDGSAPHRAVNPCSGRATASRLCAAPPARPPCERLLSPRHHAAHAALAIHGAYLRHASAQRPVARLPASDALSVPLCASHRTHTHHA